MDTRNLLLSRLPPDELARLAPHLEPVALASRERLFEPLRPIEWVHFLEGGLSSEISISSGGERIEVGCVGREGMTAVPAVLGLDTTSHHAFMQVGGPALRIALPALQAATAASPALHAALLRYVHVFMIQIAATALADGRFTIEQRLARWLLMVHDRLEADELPMTHDFLSLMLGVRRPGVTEALHVLEGKGAIHARRALLTMRDRGRLEAIAGDCYGAPEAEYRRVVGAWLRG